MTADGSDEPTRKVLGTAEGLHVHLASLAVEQSIAWHTHTSVADTIIGRDGRGRAAATCPRSTGMAASASEVQVALRRSGRWNDCLNAV